MGLRLSEGVDPRRYQALSGREFDRDKLRTLIEDGFVERDASGRVRVTAIGAPLLDAVVADIAA